jgi:hypothetical protein
MTQTIYSIVSPPSAPSKPIFSPTDIERLNLEKYDLKEVPIGRIGCDLKTLLGLPDVFQIKLYAVVEKRPYNYSYSQPVVEPEEKGLLIFLTANWEWEKSVSSPLAFASKYISNVHIIIDKEKLGRRHYSAIGNIPSSVLTFDFGGRLLPIAMDFRLADLVFGVRITETLGITVNGLTFPGNVLRQLSSVDCDNYGYGKKKSVFDFTQDTFGGMLSYISVVDRGSKENLLRALFPQPNPPPLARCDGVGKLYNVLEPLAKANFAKFPLHYLALRTFASQSHRTVDGIKLSTVFNETLGEVKTIEQLAEALDLFVSAYSPEEPYRYSRSTGFDTTVKELPIFKTKRKTALKTNTSRAFNKLMEDFDFLDLDPAKYPLLNAAIQAGDIPISTFFRKKEQYFLLNDNFPLWEKMLNKHREVTCELAKEVSRRSTYEKDLMSYFYFILYGLPEYLKKQTGLSGWSCIPKFVESATELDAPAADGTGTVRTRSSLTPTVDNTSRVVTVPYASFSVPGRQTQYCYSHSYHVLQRGFSLNGNTVMRDIEEELNGKDDYGLMFYTLTGSPTARGYPTFLIIFEKRKAGVYVHFHRTHPSRSKDGDYNPVHNWIKVCYNWMAGNVNKSRLKVQQGDLIFAETDKAPESGYSLGQQYDNHVFEKPVLIAPYVGSDKSVNILGFVKVEQKTDLIHHEHDRITIEPGTYEIRQCRSWEANPKGIWTLRID